MKINKPWSYMDLINPTINPIFSDLRRVCESEYGAHPWEGGGEVEEAREPAQTQDTHQGDPTLYRTEVNPIFTEIITYDYP